MLTNFLAAGNAAHLIAILTGLGLAAAAVGVAALWGVGQFSGRLVDVALGGRLHPLTMTLIVCLLLPLSFALALASDGDVAMLAVYALAYGACNGLLTIARGTRRAGAVRLPQLRRGGGRLLIPSFLLTAAAPVAYAQMVERHGARGAIVLSTALAAGILACAAILRLRFIGRARQGG